MQLWVSTAVVALAMLNKLQNMLKPVEEQESELKQVELQELLD